MKEIFKMVQKKVLILTHQLGKNYGGIMQAYALQAVLRTLNIEPHTTFFVHKTSLQSVKTYAKYCVRRVLKYLRYPISDMPLNAKELTTNNTKRFIEKYIDVVNSNDVCNAHVNQSYSALITGSDQVWRQAYVPVQKYLFDFADQCKITRISYAASFGTDNLSEYDTPLRVEAARLIQKFDGISVREDSGVRLAKESWGVAAEQHVDPTMLLDKQHYINLITSASKSDQSSNGEIFLYILDRDKKKNDVATYISAALGKKIFEILPQLPTSRRDFLLQIDNYQLPPVTQWLKSFYDASFIITDSFHGTVFSIIFNKPFIAVGNVDRGQARFLSLLTVFGLKDRLVSDVSELSDELINSTIDWHRVNQTLEQEKARSFKYLEAHLMS